MRKTHYIRNERRFVTREEAESMFHDWLGEQCEAVNLYSPSGLVNIELGGAEFIQKFFPKQYAAERVVWEEWAGFEEAGEFSGQYEEPDPDYLRDLRMETI